MEDDQNYKKEYDENLAIYSRKKMENANAGKIIAQLENNINHLLSEFGDCSADQSQEIGQEDKSRIAELNSQIEHYFHILKQTTSDIESESARFNSLEEQLGAQRHHQEQQSSIPASSIQQLNAIENQIQLIRRTVIHQAQQISSISSQIDKDQRQLAELSAQLARLEQTINRDRPKETVGSSEDLEQALLKLQEQCSYLQGQMLRGDVESERQIIYQFINQSREALVKEQSLVDKERSKEQDLRLQLSKYEKQKMNVLAQIKKLQNNNHQLQKHIDDLSQALQAKRADKGGNQEQSKKHKEKRQKNQRLEIIEAEKNYQNLGKEMQRERQKLSDTLRLSKAYVNQENLQILQKELSRHQALSSKVNAEAEESKKAKYLKENNLLKSRIQFLKNTSINLEDQADRAVRELRKAGDELVKAKLAQEKFLTQTTTILNLYMKEYPGHQKNKELLKLEERRKKAEEKQRVRESAREQKQRRKLQAQFKAKSAEQLGLQDVKNNLAAWEKWDKWEGKNLPLRDQTSIFNNRQLQLACAVVAVLGILFLVFA